MRTRTKEPRAEVLLRAAIGRMTEEIHAMNTVDPFNDELRARVQKLVRLFNDLTEAYATWSRSRLVNDDGTKFNPEQVA